MKSSSYILLLTITISMFLSCDFIAKTKEYKETSEVFLDNIKTNDFDKNVEYIFWDSLKTEYPQKKFEEFSNQLLTDFDSDFNFTFIKIVNNSDYTRLVYQIQDQTDFTEIELVYDDNSKKLTEFQYQEGKRPIPKTFKFWIFAICSLLVPAFNIYVIRLIYKSNKKQKWIKYLAVILLNVTTITYCLANGISFNLLSGQLMLGISYSFAGFLGSTWSVGFPIGGLYWFWRLKIKNNE